MKFMPLLRNNLLRISARKSYALVSLILTFVFILIAVFLGAQMETKGRIAVIGAEGLIKLDAEQLLAITYLDEMPPKSALVMNRYHAVAIPSPEGWEVISIQNEEFISSIASILTQGTLPEGSGSNVRPVGVAVLGLLSMFILMQGFIFMGLFREDKETGTLKRTVTSSVSLGSVLAAHTAVNFVFLYSLTLAVIGVCLMAGMDLGFSFIQYAGMLTVITLLSSTFALFITSALEKEDGALAVASIIVIASSVLSGSLYAVSDEGQVLHTVGSWFPQRSFLTTAEGISKGGGVLDYLPELAHVLIVATALSLGALYIARRRYTRGYYL